MSHNFGKARRGHILSSTKMISYCCISSEMDILPIHCSWTAKSFNEIIIGLYIQLPCRKYTTSKGNKILMIG